MKLFEDLTSPEKVKVLLIALDFMEQCNGRGKFKCIEMALKEFDHTPSHWRFKLKEPATK